MSESSPVHLNFSAILLFVAIFADLIRQAQTYYSLYRDISFEKYRCERKIMSFL